MKCPKCGAEMKRVHYGYGLLAAMGAPEWVCLNDTSDGHKRVKEGKA